MTAFDALMSGGGVDGFRAGGRAGAGGAAGDWRQAVEQAQAKSWLGNRNVDAGRTPSPRSEAPSKGMAAAVSSRPMAAPDCNTVSEYGRRSEVLAERSLYGVDTTSHEAPAPLAQRHAAMSVAILARSNQAASSGIFTAPRPVAPAALAYAQGARPRKQSLHVESGEQGLSVWLRDAALNSRQANHIAAAIVANLEGADQPLAALYLNGRAVVNGPASVSSLLSSPKTSE